MNHDIMHCTKSDCVNSDNCKRYQAHLETLQPDFDKRSLSFISYCDGDLCNGRWFIPMPHSKVPAV